jgi:hypothetical protein
MDASTPLAATVVLYTEDMSPVRIQELIQHYKTRTHSGEQSGGTSLPLLVFLVRFDSGKLPQEFSLETQISKTDRM